MSEINQSQNKIFICQKTGSRVQLEKIDERKRSLILKELSSGAFLNLEFEKGFSAFSYFIKYFKEEI